MMRGFAVGVWLASSVCLWGASSDDDFSDTAQDLIDTWTVCPSSGCTSQRRELGDTVVQWT